MEEKSEKTAWMVLALVEAVIIAGLLALVGHLTQQPQRTNQSEKIEKVGYNVEKDRLINDAISEPYLSRSIYVHDDVAYYELFYNDYDFLVVQHNQVQYEWPEIWEYFCRDVSGNNVFLTSYCDIPEHKVSPATLQKLRDICLEK